MPINNTYQNKIKYLTEFNGWKFCKIFDNKNELVSICQANDIKAFTDKLIQFLEFYDKGRYSLEFRTDKSGKIENSSLHFIDTRSTEEREQVSKRFEKKEEPQNINSSINIDKQIEQRVNAILEKRSFEEDKKLLEYEKEKFNSFLGKAEILFSRLPIQEILTGFMQMKASPVMQGQPNKPLTQMNNETENNIIEVSETDYKSLELLLSVMDSELLTKFANHLSNNPNLVNTLKSFLPK